MEAMQVTRWWRRGSRAETAAMRYPQGLGDTRSTVGSPVVAALADHLLREANRLSGGGEAPQVELDVPLRQFLESYNPGLTRGGRAFIMGKIHMTEPEPLFSDFRRDVVEPALNLMRTAAPGLVIRMTSYTGSQYVTGQVMW